MSEEATEQPPLLVLDGLTLACPDGHGFVQHGILRAAEVPAVTCGTCGKRMVEVAPKIGAGGDAGGDDAE